MPIIDLNANNLFTLQTQAEPYFKSSLKLWYLWRSFRNYPPRSFSPRTQHSFSPDARMSYDYL